MLRIAVDSGRLPDEIGLLSPREQEAARIVYALRAAAAEDVARNLADRLANATVRTILNRLVRKGILKRVLSARAYIYLPAVSCHDSKLIALRRFADDHFGGSLELAATTMKKATNGS